MEEIDFINKCKEKVLLGKKIDEKEAIKLFNIKEKHVVYLAKAANEITRKFNGFKVDVEELNNIKKNACSEDCSFCAQSAFYNTKVETYTLPPLEEILNQAKKAKNDGARSYCLVAAWRQPSEKDFQKVCNIIKEIKKQIDIEIECSLGFLTLNQAYILKKIGVKRYNHNLETARSKFPEICSTHTFDDRINTLKIARKAGLELCTGGILGIGETKIQRLELILEISNIQPEEVTINILVPIPGTPLELQKPLKISEIVKSFAVLRFLLPFAVIKISGGREKTFSDSGEILLKSGANGIITAGYLTMNGNEPTQDIKMIEKLGLEY